MYTKYVTSATSTMSDISEDIKKLLTGTTDVNLLSSSCDKVITIIDSSWKVAGWELWDDNAGTNIKVYRAPVYDNPAQFKYLKVECSANLVTTSTGEGWNATTHIGVNFQNSVYGQRVSLTQSTVLFIHATNRLFKILSAYASIFGNQYSYGYGLYEYTRWSPWDTSTALFTNWVANNWSNCIVCGYGSYKDSNGLNTHQSWNNNATNTTFTPFGAHNTPNYAANASGTKALPVIPVFFSHFANGLLGGNISECCEVYTCFSVPGSSGDEITLGNTTYIFYPGATGGSSFSTTAAMLIPKG